MAEGKKISELDETQSIEAAHYFAVTDGVYTEKVSYSTIKDDIVEYSEYVANAVSPTVTPSEIDGGHRLTITDINGTSTVDVLDGANAIVSIGNEEIDTITARQGGYSNV